MPSEKPAAARKDSHIDLALDPHTRSLAKNGFDRLSFTHCALPETDLASIDLSAEFLGYGLSAPLLIGAMTGGTPRADLINDALASVAEAQSIAFAVGSQRAALETGQSARRLRDLAPSIPIIGNLGGVQLAQSGGIDMAKAAIDDLQADAIAIHLNPLQEAVQPEGETNWRGVKLAIGNLVKFAPVPVLVKEVGAGINAALAAELFDMGVIAVDVAGFGGTNWARIEAARRAGDANLFAPFLDWGLPTVDCLREVCDTCPDKLVIASGGVRHGLDAAKAIWLGAGMVSAAGVMLAHLIADNAEADVAGLSNFVQCWKQQMALTLFLTGSDNFASFKNAEARLDGDRHGCMRTG
jgi:isopentenyl-diphosphate delta-isomerase